MFVIGFKSILFGNTCQTAKGADLGMCGFQRECLNGVFVLDQECARSVGNSCNPSMVQLPRSDHAHPSADVAVETEVVCRCTDRFSTKAATRPDRWHLEVDGQVLAYRLGTEFGATVAGWFEWLDGKWGPTEACARAGLRQARSTVHVEARCRPLGYFICFPLYILNPINPKP